MNLNDDFAPFELAVKLEEKGFCCKYPIAMYNVKGVFHELYTSVGNMQYYDYDDFDERDTIAPTISQVLKWLRKEKKIFVSILPVATFSTIDKVAFYYLIEYNSTGEAMTSIEQNIYRAEWNDAALDGISYVLDNLI